jgi:hypothetical protein
VKIVDVKEMLRNRRLLPAYCLCGQRLDTIKDDKGRYRYYCEKCKRWMEE